MSPAPTPARSSVLLAVEPVVRHEVDRTLRRRLQRRGLRMLAALGLPGVELSVLLAGDATVARLNETWRRKRGPTDVLSFPQADAALVATWAAGAPAAPRPSGDAPERVLGDLVISLPVVRRRSPGAAAFEADLVTLLAHGLLHLVGHDHERAPERRAMLALQDRLVAVAGARGPVQPVAGVLAALPG